jgi:hypothetical protein
MKEIASSSERKKGKYDKMEQKQSVRKKQRRKELRKQKLRRNFGDLLNPLSIA